MVDTRSYQVGVTIQRPDDRNAADGQEFIDYWTHALMSDLFAVLDISGPAAERAPLIARAAARWFAAAWRRAIGTAHGRFDITGLTIRLFSKYGCQGSVLAEINVLTGGYELR